MYYLALLVVVVLLGRSADAAPSTLVRTVCPSGWVESVSVAGKCYSTARFDTSKLSALAAAVEPCTALTPGGDVLAIGNAFENEEIKSLLASRRLSQAYFGFVRWNRTDSWLSSTGFTDYRNLDPYNYYDYTIAVPGAIDERGFWTSYGSDTVLCQLYPNRTDLWPRERTACPAGWTASVATPGKCAQLTNLTDSTDSPVTYTFTFFDAWRMCDALDADLWTIGNSLEQFEFYGGFRGAYVLSWTSYRRDSNTSEWRWTGRHPSNYTPPLDVLDGDKLCARADDAWVRVADCSDTMLDYRYAICERYPSDGPRPRRSSDFFPCPAGFRPSSSSSTTTTVVRKCIAVAIDDADRSAYSDLSSACRTRHPEAVPFVASSSDEELRNFADIDRPLYVGGGGDDDGKGCATLLAGQRLSSSDCDARLGFVCQIVF